MVNHEQYNLGKNAANRALDQSTFNASDLLSNARDKERMYRAQERHDLAEWNKGYGDMVQEFLNEKGT